MHNRKSGLNTTIARSTETSALSNNSDISGHTKYTFTQNENLGANRSSVETDDNIKTDNSEIVNLELSMSDS